MIDEDTLLLYYYNDGLDADERAAVQTALDSDSLLAARYARLSADLDGIAPADEAAAPEHLKHQWHAAIDSAAKLESQKSAPARQTRPFMPWLGATAAALVIGIAIGIGVNPDPDPVPDGLVDTMIPEASNAKFRRGLQVHLQDAKLDLEKSSELDADQQAILLMQIVMQNRAFERAAEANGAPDVARLMRAFEPILLRLAAEDVAPEDAESLRDQLAFELKAMLTKYQQSTSEDATSI